MNRYGQAFVPVAGGARSGQHAALRDRRATRRVRTARRAPRACQSSQDSAAQERHLPHELDNLADTRSVDSTGECTVEIHAGVDVFDADEWDSLARGGSGSPFLQHAFLLALEESACACTATGWSPRHIAMRGERDELVAVVPAYVKTHSLGEFVFDQQWAEAAYAAGIRYYPKLLVAVPFTPASGRRILTSPAVDATGRRGELLTTFSQALLSVCEALGVGSVHVNFCEADEADALEKYGFLRRQGTQFHFENQKKAFEGSRKYIDFEDYLGEFRAKRRGNIRRERRIVREESGLLIEVVRGDAIDVRMMDEMFEIYKATIDKLFFGRQYLNRAFFRLLLRSEQFRERLCFVLARRKNDGKLIAGTFNVVGENNGAFYGRYWGCLEEHRYLHFETCYYAAIEHCIDNGLARMEPGAGGGDFKYMRGFEPAITTSMHYIRDRRLSAAVRRFLLMETEHLDAVVEEMNKASAIRAKQHQSKTQGDQCS